MWTYFQSSGELRHDGETVGFGYSGYSTGRNNPDLESEADIGPIPRGHYTILPAYNDPGKGPCVMRLMAHDPIYDRSGFEIHGDSGQHPGAASHGCIVLGHNVRERVALSLDRDLTVERSLMVLGGELST
jgi:hypothetical protein